MQINEQEENLPAEELPVLVVKYGGNAMRSQDMQEEILRALADLHGKHFRVVLVHGGGPFIAQLLETAGVESEFVNGQRKTSTEAMPWVEMALKGKVNGQLVRISQKLGMNAVGLSGKDGRVAVAEKYWMDEKNRSLDLGRVGRIKMINTRLLKTLLDNDFLPILSCVALGEDGADYNVNADVFASAIAGAVGAKTFVLLTDVDGLRRDAEDPDTLIAELTPQEADQLIENGTVQGGMIPKVQSCISALEAGVNTCFILNGTKPTRLSKLMNEQTVATRIVSNHD